MFLVIISIEQQMAAEAWKALICASERSSPPLASWQHVPHILLHVVICCVHTSNSMKTQHPTLVCLLATCCTHSHTNCVLIQYNSIKNKAPTYRTVLNKRSQKASSFNILSIQVTTQLWLIIEKSRKDTLLKMLSKHCVEMASIWMSWTKRCAKRSTDQLGKKNSQDIAGSGGNAGSWSCCTSYKKCSNSKKVNMDGKGNK